MLDRRSMNHPNRIFQSHLSKWTLSLMFGASLIFGQESKSIPFNQNCQSMQNWYNNTVKWNVSTKFSGFESSKMEFKRYKDLNYDPAYNEDVSCHNGYITETSPMGKRVCLGTIHYYRFISRTDTRDPETKWYSKSHNDCRWVK